MKIMSAAALKGYRKNRDLSAPPKAGTKIRAMYDDFMSHKCEPVDVMKYPFPHPHQRGQTLGALRNIYGLDIRRCGLGKQMLVGEWCGRVYVDYLAEKINADT